MIEKHKEKEILLTISILVSGRNETTRKCLESLKSLREQISCELLLTDTGCSKDMRRWIEEFADGVFDFTWCDDFSAARNVGLKEAKGKWFLYMDDDEWFENTSEIEYFFKSGEYRKYHSASYIVRNFKDWNGDIYSELYVSRMTEIVEGMEFKYPIHEALNPLLVPHKYLDAFVHHYGYVYNSMAEVHAKHERNIGPLQKIHEEEPYYLKHHAQMMMEYNAIADHEKSLTISYKGISDYDDSRAGNQKFLNALYVNIIQCHIKLEEYEKAYQEAKRLINDEKSILIGVAALCRLAIYVCYKTERYQEGIVFLENYLKLKEALESNKEVWKEQQTILLHECFLPIAYRDAMTYGFFQATVISNKDKTEELLSTESQEWWENAIRNWCWQVPVSDIENLYNHLETTFQEKNLYRQLLLMRISEWRLVRGIEGEINALSFQKNISSYARKVIVLYKKLYNTSVFEEYPELLPKEYKVAWKIQAAIRILQQRDYVNALKELKQAAEMETGMTEVIRKFSELLGKEAKHEQSVHNRDKDEFAFLAKGVKEKVWKMIQDGDDEAALETVDQLRSLIPEDMELKMLENSIRLRK